MACRQEVLNGLQQQVRQAASDGSDLEIRGTGSKAFLGVRQESNVLSSLTLDQVISYDPSELVVTVQAGVRIRDLEELLAQQQQRLAFEPPMLSVAGQHRQGTVGGMIATALAGPRRPWSGGVRDAVLGLQLINGKGELLNFGGQVMKNVAGYDVSRLMVGAMGCLGLITQVSLKVLPAPEQTLSVILEEPVESLLQRHRDWHKRMSPVAGIAHDGDCGYVRLEGSARNLEAFVGKNDLSATQVFDVFAQGAEAQEPGIWQQLRNLSGAFFDGDGPLWRISAPPGSNLFAELSNIGSCLLDWGGAQYWVKTEDETQLKALVSNHNACLYAYDADEPRYFPSLEPAIAALHKQLKLAYDPASVFNRGRMYAEW